MFRDGHDTMVKRAKAPPSTILKRNLIQFRRLKRWSQQVLADQVGVSRKQISHYERGEALPEAKTLFQIARALGVPVGCLVPFDADARTTGAGDLQFFRSSDVEQWNQIYDQMKSASTLLTVSRRIDSFIQTDEMYRLHNPLSFKTAETGRVFDAYVATQRKIYADSDFTQVLVFPRLLFSIDMICGIEWRTEFFRQLKAPLERPSYLCCLNAFPQLVRNISVNLNPVLHGFSKMSLINYEIAVFHFDRNISGPDMGALYNPGVVRNIGSVVLEHLKNEGYNLSSDSFEWKSRIDSNFRSTVSRMLQNVHHPNESDRQLLYSDLISSFASPAN